MWLPNYMLESKDIDVICRVVHYSWWDIMFIFGKIARQNEWGINYIHIPNKNEDHFANKLNKFSITIVWIYIYRNTRTGSLDYLK